MGLVVGAHHMSFPVRDLARSRAFYEGVLGLASIPRPTMGVDGIWYQAGACEVHLIVTPAGVDVGGTPPSLNPVARHAAFAVASYEEALAQLKRHGLEALETSPARGQLWVRDPDGHIIELIVPRNEVGSAR